MKASKSRNGHSPTSTSGYKQHKKTTNNKEKSAERDETK